MLDLQLCGLLLELDQSSMQAESRASLLDHGEDVVDAIAPLGNCRRDPAARGREISGCAGKNRRPVLLCLHPLEKMGGGAGFQIGGCDPPVHRAGAAFAALQATVALPFVHGHSAAAKPAVDEVGERPWCAPRARGAAPVDARLTALLHPFPQRFADDAQRRHFLNGPLRARVWLRLSFAGIGIAYEVLAVVDDDAAVELVVEDAVSPFAVAVDGDRAPGPAAGAGDAFGV